MLVGRPETVSRRRPRDSKVEPLEPGREPKAEPPEPGRDAPAEPLEPGRESVPSPRGRMRVSGRA